MKSQLISFNYVFRRIEKHAHLGDDGQAQLYLQVQYTRRMSNPLRDQQYQRQCRLHQATSAAEYNDHILFQSALTYIVLQKKKKKQIRKN